jgi:hypothetical protein
MHFPITLCRFAGIFQLLLGNNYGGSTKKCLELKSKALHKSASKINPGTLPELPKKLNWHFAKSAYKNIPNTSKSASVKTLLAL